MKKVFLPLILCAMLLLLPACGKQEAAPETNAFAVHYDSEFAILPHVRDIPAAGVISGQLYYATEKQVDEHDSVLTLYVCPSADAEPQELTAYTDYLTGQDVTFFIEHILPGPEEILVLLGRKLGEDTEREGSGTPYQMTLDKEGKLLSGHVCPDSVSYAWGQHPLAIDSAGTVYLAGYNEFLLLDQSGNTRSIRPQAGETPAGVTVLPDGTPGAVLRNEKGYLLRKIRDGKLEEASIALPAPGEGGSLAFYSGGGDYDLYCSTGLSLYGYRLSDGGAACEAVLNWVNCNVDGNGLLCFSIQENGELICAAYSENLGGGASVLRKSEREESGKTQLTLACRGMNTAVTEMVMRFNRSNPDYQVIIADYDAYDPGAGAAAGLDRLNADLAAGRVPDLLCTEGMDLDALARLGLLEDLWPYIDADAGLGGRDGLVTPLFDAMTRDGHLYEVSPAFQVYTMLGTARFVGESSGWTWEQFWDCYDSLDEPVVFFYHRDESFVLENYLLPHYLSSLVEDGVFHGEDFRNLLSLAALFPGEKATTGTDAGRRAKMLAEGGMLLHQTDPIGGAYDYQKEQGYWNGQGLTVIGYPGIGGNGAVLQPVMPLAMMSASGSKEGAWAFLHTVLSAEGQILSRYTARQKNGIPTSRPVYDEMIRAMMTSETDPLGEALPKVDIRYDGTLRYTADAWTQGQADAFWSFLSGARTVQRELPQVEVILLEEAAKFFDGTQDADSAVKNAESRIGLYLSERK